MATKRFRFLTTDQVRRLYDLWVSPKLEPSQPHMLESAVNSPINLKHYANQNDIFQLAASLSEKIMKNHAYQDGNKRTALVAADMFLKINGFILQEVPFQEDTVNRSLADAHISVVTNQWTAEQLGKYYKSIAKPLEDWTPDILAFKDDAVEY